LPVLSSLGSGERLHDLLVVMHHLLLLPWCVCLSLLEIKHRRLGRAITKMLDRPPFVGGPVNPTRGRGLNPMLP
jgi:hypothetical protein